MMQKFGISVEQMSAHGQAAVHAAARLGSRTMIYSDRVAIAAIVSVSELARLAPADPADSSGEDPLLSLCGTFNNDAFVDQMSDLTRTALFRR